jgi:phospholipid/cholesterol/gamma-HCH transport system ATP-binding protein
LSIEIRNLHKKFGSKRVLNGFSLDVKEGETISVIGHSGAGKSVTLKTIIGLIRPDQGEVWVDGKNVFALARRICTSCGGRLGTSSSSPPSSTR